MKKATEPKKKRAKKPTNSVRLTGCAYDWYDYPPEWDVQGKKLQEDYEIKT
jgi:hypothetical protein